MKANDNLITFGAPAGDEEYVMVAPGGTTPPTSASEELSDEFLDTGLVSEDGITRKIDLGKEDPKRDWAKKPRLSPPGSPSEQVTVPFLSQNAVVNRIKYGTDNVTVAEDGSTMSAGFDGTTDEWVVVVNEVFNDEDGNPKRLHRIVYPRAVPKELGDEQHVADDFVVIEVTFDLLTDDSGKMSHEYWASATEV